MKRLGGTLVTVGLFLGFFVPPVFAQYTSSNYKADEVFFGTGGDVDLNSAHYNAQSSVGSLGVGETGPAGTTKALTGFLTPGDPFLELSVGTSSVNLGDLDTSSAKTGTATFQVRAYTDSGYVVKTISSGLRTSTGYTIANMSSQAASSAGTEQFGINLKANTSPATFGADPSPQPDSSFANGIAATGYDTANQYKYVAGDTIAQTNTSGWGLTIFTISYIANISSITKAGAYSMDHDLVAIPTY